MSNTEESGENLFVMLIILVGTIGYIFWKKSQKKNNKKICTKCGSVNKIKYSTPGTILIEITLWLLFLVPGLIYSLWRHGKRKAVCSECNSDTLISLNSPQGNKIQKECMDD